MARSDLPEGLVTGAFRVGTAIELGASTSRLRAPDLARPFWGIRARDNATSHAQLARAFLPRMPERAFFFGTTAARLHGIPIPTRFDTPHVHIAVVAGARRVQCRGIAMHHVTIQPADIIRVDGMRLTGLERTWCDLGASGLTVAELVAAGDALLWRRMPKSSPASLAGALRRFEGRRGTRRLHDALPMLSARSDSAPESELRVAIMMAGLPHPAVNQDVFDHQGRFVARPDLSWPHLRIALDYEGDHHRTDRRQWHRDLGRFDDLQELGWTTYRASARDYRDPSHLLARLARTIQSRPSP